jgi:hypothetical protein
MLDSVQVVALVALVHETCTGLQLLKMRHVIELVQ